MLKPVFLILLSIILLGISAKAQLPGCPTGCDTLIYDSDFNNAPDYWKNEPLNPLSAGCSANNGDRWEWGTLVNAMLGTCNNCAAPNTCSSYDFPAPHPQGQTKFWATELNGCFCNSLTGVDSFYIYKIVDLGEVTPPIRMEIEHWVDGCSPDHIGVAINDTVIWTSSGSTERQWNSSNVINPVLTNAAGKRGVVVTIIFFMTSVCNGQGGIVPKLDIRGCKTSCFTGGGGGGGAVPTASEWGLIFLALVFINLSLILRKSRVAQTG